MDIQEDERLNPALSMAGEKSQQRPYIRAFRKGSEQAGVSDEQHIEANIEAVFDQPCFYSY